MKILIDIGHPAHVHYFKNLFLSRPDNSYDVLFTCRNKEVTIDLLEYYKFNYINLGANFKTKLGKLIGLFYFTIRVFSISIKYRPNVYLNASIYSGIVAWLRRKPHISIEDTFNMEQVNLYLPFTSCILTGAYEHPKISHKEVRISSYQELLYLHPKYFEPNKKVLDFLGVREDEIYTIIRFVSWNASHDIGHHGISYENKLKLVSEISKLSKVFISSETELKEDLKPYQISIPPHLMHDAIAHSSLLIGESATMASEAAVLGIPSIYLDNVGRFYTFEIEKKYGLVTNYTESEEDQIKSINKAIELLSTNEKQHCFQKRKSLLDDHIDFTSFLSWFIDNYPQSHKIMKENPDFQYKFK